MILQNPSGPPVYRLRASTGTDSYGDPVEGWDTPDRLRLRGATVQDVSVVEDEGVERRIIRGQKRLYIPGKADVTEDDRVEVDGEVWKVDGTPVFRTGLGSSRYTTAVLTAVSIG